MMALYIIIALVALQRLVELLLARRNTRLLKSQGGIETGAHHYPLFILLHTSWLLAILLTTPAHAPVNWWILAVICASPTWPHLGYRHPRALLDDAHYKRSRRSFNQKRTLPFFLSPQYIIVTGEVALLPLVFGNWQACDTMVRVNAMLLAWRIRVENATLKERFYAVRAQQLLTAMPYPL